MADELEVEGVEKVEPASVPPPQQAPAEDPEQEFKQTLEEVNKLVRDKENYKKLALKYKSEDEIKADLAALDPQSLTPKTEGQPPASETIDVEKARIIRQNKELRLALQGKNNVQAVGAGTTGDTPPTKNAYFTVEQKAEMKRRWQLANIPESQHADMLKRAESAARNSSIPGTA